MAIAVAARRLAAVGIAAVLLALLAAALGFFRLGLGRGFRSKELAEPCFDAVPPAGRLLGRYNRRRLGVLHAFHRRLGAGGLGFFAAEGHVVVFFRLDYALIARRGIFIHIIGAHAADFVMRVFEMGVGNQKHRHIQALFKAEQFGAFFVEQEGGHIHRHLRVHFAGVVFHRLFLNDAQHMQRSRFNAANHAGAGAARAGHMAAFAQRGLEALAAQFEQAEAGKFAHLHAGAVFFERIAQGVFHIALVLGVFHIDKVDHHQAAQVAQTHLARHFFSRFHIGFEGGVFNIGTARGTGGVHIHRHQRFGVVDHNRAARGQAHAARKRALDLVLDLETGKQRRVVVIKLQTAYVIRHHIAHKLGYLLVHLLIIHQNLTDIGAEIIAHGANQKRAFHKQKVRLVMRIARFFDGLPQLQQIVEIPLQLFHAAADAGGAGNQAHAARHFQFGHRGFELLALFALNAARHAAAARIIGHQHQIAAGQADKGGERRAFVAALVFFHLHNHFHALFEHVLNAGTAAVVILEISARHFLKRQKAVPVGAVIYETRFQRRLDTGNHAFIDIAFALLFAQRFDIEI